MSTMSQPDISASLADTQPSKAKQAANAQKAADNRARAQQNRERAANNRNPKASAFDQDAKAAPAPASAQPSKRPARRDAAKPAATRQGKASTHFKSKVVIRRLPPNLPEAVFWKAVSPWIRDAADCQPPTSSSTTSVSGEASASTSSAPTLTPTVDFKQFIPGKLKTDASKQNKHARAYVRFLDAHALVLFHKHFDGHIFRDSKARETVAMVEFAPYQKVVPARGRRSKPDPKQGTIEADGDYLAFVERLSNVGDDAKRAEGDLLASTYDPRERAREREAAAAAGKSTPLLEHLRAVKQAKLESAALAKKAKKAERAAAKAAARNADGAAAATAMQPAEPAIKKAKKGKRHRTKEKLAAVDAAHVGGGKEIEAGGQEPPKREKKSRQRKGKRRADGVDANAANTDAAPKATNKPESAKKQSNPTKDAPNAAEATPARNPKQAGGRPAKKKSDAKAPAAENSADAGVAEGDGSTRKKPPRRKGGAKTSTKPPTASTATAPASQPKLQILKREPAP
ncbi:uncharacterized protein PAN0_001c0638 [Moesziomyces antarcticus]|nr:uncharacterized protein PAN0_001c0638 [Moesziomyces antarcticus]GAK62438.1 conserved hypothetical protein [Moesziomyces antarcticus]